MEFRGIDISEYQGEIDFGRVKQSGIDFVMIRSGYGRNSDQRDSYLERNIDGARAAGLDYGFYHYAYATTPERAAEEADFCLELIRGSDPTMPVAYDIEDASLKGLSREQLSTVARTFLERIRAAGYYPMLYASLSWLNNRFEPSLLEEYDVWLAQWAPAPTYTGEFGMWQYTSSGRVPGVSTAVDLNVAYKDYPAIIAEMEEVDGPWDNTPSPYAAEAVAKAIELGILRGNQYGDLMLHSPLIREDFFVLIDRLGLLG